MTKLRWVAEFTGWPSLLGEIDLPKQRGWPSLPVGRVYWEITVRWLADTWLYSTSVVEGFLTAKLLSES